MTALSKNPLHPKCQDSKGARATLRRSQDTDCHETANCAALTAPQAPKKSRTSVVVSRSAHASCVPEIARSRKAHGISALRFESPSLSSVSSFAMVLTLHASSE